MEFQPPKYVRVVTEIQNRITRGVYGAGDMLPSESQLVGEFHVGRTTVVRALEILKRDGWIEREHGRGSFVKGDPTQSASSSPAGLAVLEKAEVDLPARVLHAGPLPASRQVAFYLELPEGTEVFMRRWAIERDGAVVELVSCWFPMELVTGTDLADSAPLMVSVRESLRHLKQVRFQMVKETTTARLPSADEAAILGVKRSTPVLAISAGVYDGVQPVCAVDLVLPGDSNELRDTYSVP